MEEVGSPEERQEENPGPSHRHPNSKGEGHEGVGDHQPYHTWRVAPLMRRALPLDTMAPGASLDRTALTEGELSPSEVVQCIKKAMEPLRDDVSAVLEFVYPVLGHPPMWPGPRYIVFVSFLSSCLLFNSTPDLLTLILR